MEQIQELLNRINEDEKEHPADYTLYYEDISTEEIVGVSFRDIKRVQGNFFVIEQEHGETSIPLHRIREVRKQGQSIWKRMLDREQDAFLPNE